MRWLRDIRKYPAGTNGGSGSKFPHWKSTGLTPRGSSDSKRHGGRPCAEQAELSSPTAQWPFHIRVLLRLHPTRQSTAAKAGVWHIGSCMGKRQQPCTPEKAQCPEDLNRNSKRGFTNLQWVSNRSLQCSTSDCYCLKWPSTLAQLWLDSNCWWFGSLPFFMYLTETS